MKILKSSQVKEADKYTIENEPISSIDLMERAATRAAYYILKKYDDEFIFSPLSRKIFNNDYFDKIYSYTFNIIAGPGNNGGDGLVIARVLWQKIVYQQKKVRVFVLNFTNKFSEDFKINLSRLEKETEVEIFHITSADQLPEFSEEDIIIDAIFGSGLNREVRGLPAKVIEKINNSNKYKVISVDIPSGLFGEQAIKEGQIAIKADEVLTFEFPFLSFFLKENGEYVKKIVIVPIGILPEYIEKAQTDYYLIEKSCLPLKERKKFSHKGNYGHGLLIAGGFGRSGAAVLAAKGALRSGIGLLTISAVQKNVNVFQTAIPEALIFVNEADENLSQLPSNIEKYNAIAIGPAIGFASETKKLLYEVLKLNKPLVLDADALTILAENENPFEFLPKNSIITPHPKEFQRLTKKEFNSHIAQIDYQKQLSEKYGIYIVLKNAHTTISTPEGKVYFNNTGNPGLATGGSGDVLTGMILSFLAQGYSPEDAAKLGVYFHGFAADIYVENYAQESLLPSDVIKFLPYAFKKFFNSYQSYFVFTEFPN